jgi:hypothetical protein
MAKTLPALLLIAFCAVAPSGCAYFEAIEDTKKAMLCEGNEDPLWQDYCGKTPTTQPAKFPQPTK